MAVTGAMVQKMLQDIVGKITKEWDERLGRLWESQKSDARELRLVEARVHRLEKILERQAKVALQEKP